MNIEIQNKIELSELRFALAARRSVLKARARSGKQEVYPGQMDAIERLCAAAMAAPREEPQYRYLEVGEVIHPGDEVQVQSPFDGMVWRPAKHTVGMRLRQSGFGEYRRAV